MNCAIATPWRFFILMHWLERFGARRGRKHLRKYSSAQAAGQEPKNSGTIARLTALGTPLASTARRNMMDCCLHRCMGTMCKPTGMD